MKCDFSFKHYREILTIALNEDYRFISFSDDDLLEPMNYCLLRHDIDYAPQNIPHLATIEHDLGKKATYFFQTCAWPYNSREKEIHNIAKQLIRLGHHIGLHVDLSWDESLTADDLPNFIDNERTLLSNILDTRITQIVSFHNPHKFKNIVFNRRIPGIQHTYEPKFISQIKYLSDSQGWREGCVCKNFDQQKYPKIQLLTHPYIWSETPTASFTADMAKMISAKTDSLYKYMVNYHPVCRQHAETLKKQIKKNIDHW